MIHWLKNISSSMVGEVGGKGVNLAMMRTAGFPVPNAFVLSSAFFDVWSNGSLSPSIVEDVLGAFDRLGGEYVAVRSSAAVEDAADASWAGQFESFLYVRREELLEKIFACCSCVRAARVAEYASQQGVDSIRLSLAIVVQRMVTAECSGVMFTANPVTGKREEMIIESIYGLGELLVQGTIVPDRFVVDRPQRKVLQNECGEKTKLLGMRNGSLVEVPVPTDKQQQLSLSEPVLLQLVELGERVEKHFGCPQDIEWAYEAKEICLLQARPITTLG